ncbi:MAG: FAD-binding oxidoreductase [Pseudomonadota bacterium]
MQIARLPTNDRTNGWSGVLSARTPNAALQGDVIADWIVLGAGYAGLAAARRLGETRPNESVALIDAGEAGENASGRNSGFAIDHLQNQIQTYDIACDWSADGKYHAAVSPRGVTDVLEPFAKELDALGEPYEWVMQDDLRQKIGSDHFTAAIYTPGGALMNPAALTRGLADSLPSNVTLYENSPVTQANFQNGIQLTTAEGSLRAPRMILAANGYSEQFGFYPKRFVHLVAHASLTRPLTEAERCDYGVEAPWGLTPANAFAGITMRYTNDHRILIRQGLAYCPSQKVTPADQQAVRARHQRLFAARFPSIAGVEMEHTWSGIVCLSRNSAPGFGQLSSNVWSAVCQNAVGVTKGTFGGILAADMATGQDNPLIADMQSLGAPSPLPPRPFLDIGVRSRFAWELWSNRHEA